MISVPQEIEIKPPRNLTIEQQTFVEEYLKTNSAAQAAIHAGYSIHPARVIVNETLIKPYIKENLSGIARSRINDFMGMDASGV